MSPAAPVVRAIAPAKVNPWLDVLGRRPDGYHEVDLGLLAVELADELVVVRTGTGGVELALSGPAATDDVPADARNLAARAAGAVLAHARETGRVEPGAGLELRLHKRVPSRAGLGGGSSDAAAAWVAAERACGSRHPDRAGALAALGADCVFFAEAATTGFARGRGRGDEIRALPAVGAEWSIVLIVPDLVAPTADVYRALEAGIAREAARAPVPEGLFDLEESEARAAQRNDLEPAALRVVDGLPRWRELLDASGAAHFRLSGSGTSFFGLFRNSVLARASLHTLETRARSAGMLPRLATLTRPAGHAARLDPDG